MNALILMVAVAAAPAALILLLRANAAIVFLALCAGNVLSKYLGDDVVRMFQTFSASNSTLTLALVRIGLLVLPALLTIVFLNRSVSGAKHALNILPAVLTGVVMALLVVPLLPDGTKFNIYGTQVWSTVQQFQGVIVGASVLVSMVMLWSGQKGLRRGKHH